MSAIAESSSLMRRLEDLLSQDPDVVADKVGSRWAVAGASFLKPLVFHGARGWVATAALHGLRRGGAEPVAFTDNDPSMWGLSVDGIAVISPTAAIEKWGDEAVFVVTLSTPHLVLSQLGQAGARIVVPWTWMFAADEGNFLPYWGLSSPKHIFDRADEVLAAMGLWVDHGSRLAFLKQIRWSLSLDTDIVPAHVNWDRLYFDPDIVRLRDDEVFVDCGAFDGDSLRTFMETVSGKFRSAHLLEPDPASVAALRACVGRMPLEDRARVTIYECAGGAGEGTARFSGDGSPSSAISTDGNIEVRTAALDDLLAEEKPTFIKMDVEGAELDVLAGATRILSAGASTWAIMAYHRQSHLWEVPLALSRHGDHDLHLRSYAPDFWERCVYATPRSSTTDR